MSQVDLGKNKKSRKKFLLNALAIFLVLISYSSGLLDRFDFTLWDNFLKLQQRTIASDIVIVEVDAKSIEAINTWPWSRNIYAAVADKFSKAKVNSVFIDIDFSSYSNDSDSDANLARAFSDLSETTTLRLPTFLQSESSRTNNLVLRRPISEFVADELVSVNIKPSSDGLVRFVNHSITWNGESYNSSWNAISGKNIQSTWIDYSIGIESFEFISVADLLSENFELARLSGKDVLLGATAIELGDIIAVPVYQNVPGIVLHGLAIETLQQGGLYKLSMPISILLLLLIGIFARIIFEKNNWLGGLILGSVGLLILLPVAYFFYHQFNLILPLFPVVLILSTVYITSTIIKLDSTLIQKVWLQVAFSNQKKFIDSIFSISNECILTINAKGLVLSANQKSQDIFGFSMEELVGHSMSEFIPMADQELWLRSSEPFDTNILTKSHDTLPVEICISPIESSADTIYTVAIRDMSERYEREAKLAFALDYDELTQVFNRDKFFNLSDRVLASSSICFLIKIDVDYFNEINSIYGHEIGDEILRVISGRLIEPLNGESNIGRVGKNEFAILLSNLHKEEVSDLVSRLITIVNRPLLIQDQSIEVFCHIGVASNKNDKINIEQLLGQANKALILARTRGLESEWIEQDDDTTYPHRLVVLGKIRQSLRKSDFSIAFQPKINLESSAFVGCEVLLRTPDYWDNSITISSLIENAEKTNLISPLTLFTIDRTLEIEKEWQTEKLPRNISINISIGLLSNNKFFSELLKRIDNSLGYFRFIFEITETSLNTNWNNSLSNIKRLRQRNIEISIDDFGTGYSSLSYLKNLEASELKIDMSFITGIHDDKNNQAIIRSTIKMAHELGLRVVAEGVESSLEREFLSACNCDLGQGYHFAKPMSFEKLRAWVRAETASNIVQWPFDKNR
ncbi:EAL domain-containing protein [Aurantivibrio infirmus]